MAKATAQANLKASDYVHLHNHTQYSLLDGLTKVPALVEYAKETGMVAVAQTDHGTMSGAIEFYKAATASGVKPLIGMETYVAARTIADKEPGKDKNYHHLILIAMNNEGYRNLMQLSTIANLEGVYYKPRVDHVLLDKYSEGLIVLSGCIGGEVADAIRQGQYDQALELAAWYKKTFGDRYYIEVQDHGHPEHPSKWDEQVVVNRQLIQLAEELAIPCVVTCDAHYLRHEDQTAHEILLCVQTGAFLSDEKRMSLANFELHVAPPEEIIGRWGKDHPDFITNTRAIADRCEVTIELGKILIPKFDVPEGEDEKSYLHKLTYRGLAWRYGDMDEDMSKTLTIEEAKKHLGKDVLERTTYELGIIDSMGFNGYFLIIADFMNWGKDQGIVFGPGRGSAAGSIISYALKITELDPLRYDLLFERFLNPDRISMPDVDIDIMDTRRDEVIEYCAQKYGQNRVANIVTFGTMAARNAVRDVARVLQVPYSEADRLAKMIPAPVQGHHIPLKKSLQDDADLKREYETNDTSKEVFDLAIRLEGTIRSHGVHAAGVVIAPDDIVKFAPLEMAQKGVVTTQYPKDPIEELGLLKMDFLGLSNLTIIKNALRIIKRVYGVEIDINTLPLDDVATYELFQRGDTTGVFQLESAGMKRYLKELKPTVFEDIVAMVALYRPGPMQFIDDFIARKHGLKEIKFVHPLMEPALAPTYGVLVYQEQVMQISKELAGFTGGQADTLRKAIGKKKIEVMQKMKVEFIEGAVKNGADAGRMEAFWKQLEDFAAYCFNKSHAACYGLIAYQTAYLKAHYPAAFMAAVMTSDYDDTDRLAIEITECKKMGIDVLPPDVDESFHEFAVIKDKDNPDNRKAPIRFGLDAIKNVGTGAVEEIIRARNMDGAFGTLGDFLAKASARIVNRKPMESLVKAGAFDRFGERSELLHNMDVILAYANRLQKEANSGQVDLFGALAEGEAIAKPQLTLEKAAVIYNSREQLLWERELLGIYLSQHPLGMFSKYLAEQTMPLVGLKPEHDGKGVVVGGAIIDVREITTKNGQKMAFVKLEDQTGELELILFPNAYQQTIGLWERDRVILARGKLSAKDREGNIGEELKIMVDDAREITAEQAMAYTETGRKQKLPGTGKRSAAAAITSTRKITAAATDQPPRVYVRLENGGDQDVLRSLKQVIDGHGGDVEVVLVLGPGDSRQIIKLPSRIQPSEEALGKLRTVAGAMNIKLQ
ncbi:MAG TPA: DNA polymerase III subunit alpha [Patescibacteria group bacterium]|nr:DNA polymerase III subunit alpha [Patescibacteria group bacterium]